MRELLLRSTRTTPTATPKNGTGPRPNSVMTPGCDPNQEASVGGRLEEAPLIYRDEISSMRSMGRRARSMIALGNSILGASRAMQSRTFERVFIFMYLHSLQRQESV